MSWRRAARAPPRLRPSWPAPPRPSCCSPTSTRSPASPPACPRRRPASCSPIRASTSSPRTASSRPTPTQLNPTWGLDRIDQRNLPLTTSYSYVTTGAGVHAYVIDTGIRRTHVEFTGRIGNHFDYSGGLAVDCNGHGTHLSGTIGGTTYGVAKRVTLHPVKVLDCNGSGSFAQVIAGVDWVTGNRILPAVADLSLGGAPNAALDAAVQRSINRGVVYVVSAGSSGGSACNYSPARIPAAYTVGSSTIADAAHAASNKGPCLDLFAPGINVLSAWHTGDTAWANLSGTSMAAAHAAGAAARYLQSGGSAAYLISMSSVNLLTGVPPDTVNRLLYISP